MKLRTGPLDDLHLEADLVLKTNGTRLSRLVLRVVNFAYRFHRGALLLLLRFEALRRGLR